MSPNALIKAKKKVRGTLPYTLHTDLTSPLKQPATPHYVIN